ncbi:conserved Plasmodium protein, unknown function [Plasmodium chabaudi chabaudi]|uniref:Uncharacterized protein n=1 Tax=Plasmodium chabaudi chabaudi TaxID=31271 RepID=A0A1C6YMN2_PLACU|nr:conserved Plasmodium protein, unknown function [Plasmodium chabaudi chabaudi]
MNNNNNRKNYNNNFFNEYENDKKELYKKNPNDLTSRHVGNNNDNINNNAQNIGHKRNNNTSGNWNNYNNNRMYGSSNGPNKGNKNIPIKRNLINGKPNKSMEHIKNNIIRNKIIKNYNFASNTSSNNIYNNTVHKNEFRKNAENNQNPLIQQRPKSSHFDDNKKITQENKSVYNIHNINNSNLKNAGNDMVNANNNIYNNPDFFKKNDNSKKGLINNNPNVPLMERKDKNKKVYDYSQSSSFKGYSNLNKEKKNTTYFQTNESDTGLSQYSSASLYNKNNEQSYGNNVTKTLYNNKIVSSHIKFDNSQNENYNFGTETESRGLYSNKKSNDAYKNMSENMNNYGLQTNNNFNQKNDYLSGQTSESHNKNISNIDKADESLEKKIYQTISNNKEALDILSKYFKNINGNMDPATLNNIILECKNNKVLANILNGIKEEMNNNSLDKLKNISHDKGGVYNVENAQRVKQLFKSADLDDIKNKWNMCIIKYKDKNVYSIFNNVENSLNANTKNVEIFKSPLFCNNNYHLSKNIFYNNYKIVLIHNVKYLLLENIFSFKVGSEKKNNSNTSVENADNNKTNANEPTSPFPTISYADSSFDNFCLFFNNYYQISEWYRNKLFFFLVYKIIIMDEEEEEYHSYYSIFLKILDKNTFVFFLSVLINIMKNYSLKLKYMINVIERLLPVLAKKKEQKKKNLKNSQNKQNSIPNSYTGSSTKKYILFNILYFKLLRLLFYKIENYYIQKKHLLLLFLRYIKNFLLNICNSTIIIQYLFIKCIDLMNKYNNQQYILIKTISMEILLQLWNNEFLKLSILKMGKSIIRFIIFISNVEYVNKNIFPFIISSIETTNQTDAYNYISSSIQNNKYYKQKKKRLKHFLYYFKHHNVLSLYHDEEQINKTVISFEENAEDAKVGSPINIDQNAIYGNTLFDLILQIKGSYNYFNILISKKEKVCLDFLLNMNNLNPNFHFHLFYETFIQNNLSNLVNENKLVYYFEWILTKDRLKRCENNEADKQNDSNLGIKIKGIASLNGGLKEEGNSSSLQNKRRNNFIENENNFAKKVKHTDVVSDNYDSCIMNDENEIDENLSNYYEGVENKNCNKQANEKVMYCLYELFKKNDGILSKIYCSHIKLSFFFNIFFYKSNEMSRILSSSLSTYSRKYKNFKRDNQKIIKFMNINNITHFLIVKFLLKYVGKIKCNDDSTNVKDIKNKEMTSNLDKDIFACYKILEHSLKTDISNTNSFLNYINKIILHLYEKKRENIVLSLIISFSIYNFISYIEGSDNKKVVIENMEELKLADIVNGIYQHCLIGQLLKGNNYFIDNETSVINLDDIYNYELTNHMKMIPKNINKEIFDLVNYKKYIFQKGNYKKIEVIKISKKNMINNLYTSEILNYIYYNVLYIVIHLIMNIRFYYTIFFNTYKKNIYQFSKKRCFIFKSEDQGKYTIKTSDYDTRSLSDNPDVDKFLSQTRQTHKKDIANSDDKYILLKFQRENDHNYVEKKKIIIKYYKNVKKNIIKNLKQYILVNNSHNYVKGFMQDSLYFNMLLAFYKSPICMQSVSFCLCSNSGISTEFDFNLKTLSQINDIFSFVHQVNKIVYLVVHKGLSIHKEIVCTLNNCMLDNDSIDCNKFCSEFVFYEIVTASYSLNKHTKCDTVNDKSNYNNDETKERDINCHGTYTSDNNEGDGNRDGVEPKTNNSNVCTSPRFGKDSNWLFRFSYKNDKKKAAYFNELLDYIVYSVNNSYKKERTLFWSEFFYSLKNYGIINFQIFFYLCSMLKMVRNVESELRDEIKNKQVAILKRKIKIVEKIYILYLFKIGFILNMSIYETFDFLFSIITIIFNYNFFSFYMIKKVYKIDKDKESIAKSFASYIEKEIENIIYNYDQTIFIEAIKYINDSIFLRKSIKNLILKSYSYINIIMHILPLKNIIIDMNNITYIQINNDKNNKIDTLLEQYKVQKFDNRMKNIDDECEKDDHETYEESMCSEKFSSSSNDEFEKLDNSLEYFSSHLNYNNTNAKRLNSLENDQINNIKKMWIFKIFKNFYSQSFTFHKNKTENENFYENKKKLIYFFFPKCAKKGKGTLSSCNPILDTQIYELRKRLSKDNNFRSMSRQALLLKWMCLRLFILHKYKYKTMNNSQIFNYIYKKLNLIYEEEKLIRFNSPSDANIISLGNPNLRYIFHTFLSHINNNLIYLINKCIKIFKNEGGTYIGKNTSEQNGINKKKQKMRKKKKNTAIDCVNFYSTNFLLAFYPYLIKSRISYDIFFNLFKIYFSLYLINKHNNRLSIQSPIYIILLIFSHQIKINKYVLFSYITTVVNFMHSTPLSDIFCLDSLTHHIVIDNIRDSVEYFMKTVTQENATFDDVTISYDANSISLFYHMLLSNF